jgi:hypothetical protein
MRPLFAATLLLCLAAPSAAAKTTLQAETRSWPVTRDQHVRVEFPVGELRVEASNGDRVRFELTVECKGSNVERCMERAERLKLDTRSTGNALVIEVRGYPKMNPRFSLHGVLQVPRDNDLQVEMGVGQLVVIGMEGSIDADLGVGEADIESPKGAMRRVTVEVGIGDARIRAGGDRRESSGLFGREVHWSEGSGRSTLQLNVGVGEATVSLR